MYSEARLGRVEMIGFRGIHEIKEKLGRHGMSLATA
jgi:hypothetical protein